jgi:transcriptional regulator with XRE-family HTH domain
MQNVEFNVDALALAIDAVRGSKGMNWKDVAEEAGISASTISRILQGKKPDVDNLAKLLNWCGMDFRRFIQEEKQ